LPGLATFTLLFEGVCDEDSGGRIDKNLRKIISPKINFEVWKL
jgi:hypothetical protein